MAETQFNLEFHLEVLALQHEYIVEVLKLMGEDTKRRVEAWEVGTKPLLMARRWCEMAAPLVGAGERETLTEAKAVEVLMSQCAKDFNANIQPRSTLENVWVRVDDTFYKDAGKDRFHHRRWDWDIQAAGEDKRSVRRWAYCENGDWADGDPEFPTPLLLRGSQQDKVVPEDDVMHDIAPRGYWPGETAVFPWAETKMTQGVMGILVDMLGLRRGMGRMRRRGRG